ncbi:unnamed protein product [Protopolystoma xenopodis]|uniref:Condensin complex subunit 1 C-terminal domain-containing protein n=1 Tax=Protopolystoma xenopodis TaxID=117903 RepID=A0A3S5A6W1_9PLAT|nr:unnamed protein product [Protopolystoma xenopodis]
MSALARLQDPSDAACPVVDALIWLARHDTSPEGRRAALVAMILTTRTLPVVFERHRDVADNVRKTVFTIFTARSVLRPLTIAKRIQLLQFGLTDRSVDVRAAARKLVISWFQATDSDPVLLLRRLDTEGVSETSQLCLDNLFSELSEESFREMVNTWSNNYLTDQNVIKPDKNSVESWFTWRSLIEHISLKSKQEEVNNLSESTDKLMKEKSHFYTSLLDRIIPSVTTFIEPLRRSVFFCASLVFY